MSELAHYIARHAYPADRAAEGVAVLDEAAGWILDRLDRSAVARGQALSTMLSRAQTHCVADPWAGRSETWDAWVEAMQTGSALFAMATATSDHVECRIAGTMRTLPALGSQPYADARN